MKKHLTIFGNFLKTSYRPGSGVDGDTWRPRPLQAGLRLLQEDYLHRHENIKLSITFLCISYRFTNIQ